MQQTAQSEVILFLFLFAGRSNRKITESTVIDKKILDIIW